MARFLAACFAVLILLTAFPVYADYTPLGMDPELTTNPDHKGYGVDDDEIYPIEWQGVTARCEPCKPLADAYNKAMRQLLYTRYWVEYINDQVGQREQRQRWQRTIGKAAKDATADGMDATDERRASAEMNYQEGVDALAGQLPALQAQEDSLKGLAEDLRTQLENCENKMCRGPEEYKRIAKIGDDTKSSPQLPFNWAGPYPDVCHKCAKLAARLNELPDLARYALAGLEAARADLMSAETEILIIQVQHDGIVFSYEGDTRSQEEILKEHKQKEKEVKKDLEAMERMKTAAEKEIAKYESDLDAIIKNFDETLALYNECVPTCEKQTGSVVDPVKKDEYAIGATPSYGAGCYAKLDLNESYIIGANSQYGTGAQMKNKAKDMATGAAMGALGSVLGGGGISLGGGGNDDVGSPMGGSRGGSDSPRLDKDPFKSDFYLTGLSPIKGFEIGTRAGFTEDGLLVSQKIMDSPDGNSTFHATWLQDEKGRRVLPTRYFIYDVYRDHKLTVWWTYDHWTDGVHDAHDEGREATQWREDLGSFRLRFNGEKGIENSMWYQSGFDTAVKGVRQMGASYPVSPGDLTGCGLNLVTHLTLPSQDPVITKPFFVNLHIDEPYDPDKAFIQSIMMRAPMF